MPNNYCVKIFLTDKNKDSIHEIIHGEGNSLGPTFDKIQIEAIKCKGSFEDWEPTCCKYSFPNELSYKRFIKNIEKKFKEQVYVETISNVSDKMDTSKDKIFKSLPSNLGQRIAALTPCSINKLDINILIPDNDDNLLLPEIKYIETFRFTYANMKCKITGKIRSLPVILRSGKKLNESLYKLCEAKLPHTKEIDKAFSAGWSKHDIVYDSIINSILVKDVSTETFNNDYYPEISLVCTNISVVIHDYEGEQFVGWFFFNRNLDEYLNLTQYKI